MQGNPWDVSDILLSNRSGQMLGQGIAAAGQGVGAAIRQYQQNKMLATDHTSKFEGMIKQDQSLLQDLESGNAPKDVSSAYAKLKKDGAVGARDAVLLSGYAESILGAKQRQQQSAMQQTQVDLDKQRMAILADQLSRDKSNRAAFQQAFGGAPTAADASMYLTRSGPKYTPGSAPVQQQPQPAAADADSVLRAYAKAGGELTPELGNLLARMDATQARRDTATAKPQGMIFASEKDLLDRYPSNQFDYQFTTDPQTGRVTVKNGVSPRAPINALPPGYQPDPEKPGAIRPIPGSEGDTKRQDVEAAATKRRDSEVTRAQVVLNAIEQVLPKVGGMTSGAAGTALNKIPGTDAADVASMIDTIKANIGFDQLQRMREASPTGGALGQIAVQELNYLQAALGNLSTKQSPEQLKKSLEAVRKHYDRWRQTAEGKEPADEAKPAAGGSKAQRILDKYGIK